MKTTSLGDGSLRCTRLAYGCWRLGGASEAAHVTSERQAQGRAAVLAAFEAGFTLFDHADIYCDGVAEEIFGQVLQATPGMRDRILIASKCGIRKAGEPDAQAPYRYDFSAEHIIRCCEQSLRRLRVDRIDLYQLHRPDMLCDPAEVAGAFDRLKQAGKVRRFGVSNFRPTQLAMLHKACSGSLIVHQVEISLCHLDPFLDGTLDQCLTERITPLAWSPLAGGRLCSTACVDMQDPHHAHRQKLHDTLDAIARERETSRGVVALAWLLKHPSQIVPIIGTTQPERIRELAGAAELELTREEWYRLFEAAAGHRLP